MLFHTWLFGAFFLVVWAVFLALRRTRRLWVAWLFVASYAFYAAWNPYYLILILFSTALDYWAVAFMDRCRTRRGRTTWLLVSIANNLALLAFFKYADFLVANVNGLLASLGVDRSLPSAASLMPFGWEYVLPVGISFYTFQSMSYTIDFHRGEIARERSFIRFAAYVAFFPQLVAGPIERARHLLPQFERFPRQSMRNITDGASLFLVGLFKKVALANYLAGYVERVYAAPADFGAPALMLATFCFAWQIYFDFGGYTDMARGVALAMGFQLMRNFNHPYLASGIGDFWARWHISLSTWFRDYVYIPLGGNRIGAWTTWRNLAIVFIVSGLWHGAAWTFIVWGALHAAGAIGTRLLERSAWYRDRVPLAFRRLWVFAFVCLGWIFFRAASMDDALLILRRIVSGPWNDPACPILLLGLALAVWIYQWAAESGLRRHLERPWIRVALAVAMIVYLAIGASGGGEFIYFQF